MKARLRPHLSGNRCWSGQGPRHIAGAGGRLISDRAKIAEGVTQSRVWSPYGLKHLISREIPAIKPLHRFLSTSSDPRGSEKRCLRSRHGHRLSTVQRSTVPRHEPSRPPVPSRAVRHGYCTVHGPNAQDMREVGRRGGQARPQTELRKAAAADDAIRERARQVLANALDGKPVDKDQLIPALASRAPGRGRALRPLEGRAAAGGAGTKTRRLLPRDADRDCNRLPRADG
jgi:hypothetical protein